VTRNTHLTFGWCVPYNSQLEFKFEDKLLPRGDICSIDMHTLIAVIVRVYNYRIYIYMYVYEHRTFEIVHVLVTVV